MMQVTFHRIKAQKESEQRTSSLFSPFFCFPSQTATEGKHRKSRVPRRRTMNHRGRSESIATRVWAWRTSKTSEKSLSFTTRRATGLALGEISTTIVLYWDLFVSTHTAHVEKLTHVNPRGRSSSSSGWIEFAQDYREEWYLRKRKK